MRPAKVKVYEWASFLGGVNSEERTACTKVKANADAMATKLAKFGWQYVVVDIEWYQPKARSHGYTLSSRTVGPNESQLFQPMGGVGASILLGESLALQNAVAV